MSQSERVPSYSVGTHAGRESITCGLCGSRSCDPRDVTERYCGSCHVFHDDVADPDVVVVERARALAGDLGRLVEAFPHLDGQIVRIVIQLVLVGFQARLLDNVAGPDIR